ncbi:hypothetical protein GCM10022223_46060 [Kineosporia mesophila]|uniref:Uncharacterized protein n=1 Tax=Kineosporia mesophila TaxID=566012 RepID=A0ABP7A2U0_9ACTN|nr:hypothetical protein [Kineosporia mesophila]MCD5349020.1 hypothetical protein [Kineosporia mesophila]
MADEFGAPLRAQNTTTTTEPVYDPAAPVEYTETTYTETYVEDSDSGSDSTKDVAREQAANVGHGAAQAGQHVAGVAGEQAAGVASEAADQAKNLYAQTREELRGQASTQQQRLAEGVRSLSTELESMADGANSGTASDLVREVSGRARDVAGWLDQRDPGALLSEVTDFARRRPGTFLAIAAGAGLIAGRLTRGAISEARHESAKTDAESGPTGRADAPVNEYVQPEPYASYERYDTDGTEIVETTRYEETVAGGRL